MMILSLDMAITLTEHIRDHTSLKAKPKICDPLLDYMQRD